MGKPWSYPLPQDSPPKRGLGNAGGNTNFLVREPLVVYLFENKAARPRPWFYGELFHGARYITGYFRLSRKNYPLTSKKVLTSPKPPWYGALTMLMDL